MSNAQMLINHLKHELSGLELLNSLLIEEKKVLTTRQFDQLDNLAEKKQILSNQVEESAQQRMKLIQDNSPKGSLKEFLSTCSAEEVGLINQLNLKLVEQINLCRELNTVNGQVIANNIYTRQQIVNALSGHKADAISVYTANGNITSTAGHHNHHQEA